MNFERHIRGYELTVVIAREINLRSICANSRRTRENLSDAGIEVLKSIWLGRFG